MDTFKIQKSQKQKVSSLRQYQDLVLGTRSLWFLIKYELIVLLCGSLPGALGLVLRKLTYPLIIGEVGKGVVFGRDISLRHPQKIRIGDGTIIDDYCMLDAKGNDNQGIVIGSGVFIGRHTVLYCKNGNIFLEDKVNLGYRCTVFSSNEVKIGEGTLFAADCYVMSGGSYDYTDEKPFIEQDGTVSKGPLHIGKDCWLGAKVVVLDGASIGDHSVIGAGAVVTVPIPKGVVAVGIPAKVVKKIVHHSFASKEGKED